MIVVFVVDIVVVIVAVAGGRNSFIVALYRRLGAFYEDLWKQNPIFILIRIAWFVLKRRLLGRMRRWRMTLVLFVGFYEIME
jgi:hypothetical protein